MKKLAINVSFALLTICILQPSADAQSGNKQDEKPQAIKTAPLADTSKTEKSYYINGVKAVRVITNGKKVSTAGFKVNAVYPNPFTKETRISYQIPKDGVVNITISDVNGKVVKTLKSSVTDRSIVWDGSGSSGAGVYFCTLEYAGIRKTVKLVKTE